MKIQKLDRVTNIVAMALVGLVVAACTIPLRGGEEQAKIFESDSAPPDPLAARLAECRSVTYEQKDALAECRKAWTEQRRQFLGKTLRAPFDRQTPQAGPSSFVAPKDESRLPSGYPPIQQPAKE